MSQHTATLGELFSSSWGKYKQRALAILAVALISSAILIGLILVFALCVVFGGAWITHAPVDQTWTIILISLSCFFFLIISILGLWCQTALLAIVVDEDLGIIEAFQTGWDYLWPMTWVLTIFTSIIVTGFVFGILPALVCMVWFTFCFFVLLEEDKRGMDTILASLEYVKGHWWNSFGKLFVVWFLYIITGIIPFLGTIISFVFYPFLLLFMVELYHDLKSIHGEAELLVSQGTRYLWWGITAIGLIIPIIALIAIIYALYSGEVDFSGLIQQAMPQSHL